jgi:hypothetical protein
MRLSVDKDSPFYDEEKIATRPQVLIDGIQIKGCFEASEEEGWADVWKMDESGKKMLNATGDGALRERLHGHVEIRLGIA